MLVVVRRSLFQTAARAPSALPHRKSMLYQLSINDSLGRLPNCLALSSIRSPGVGPNKYLALVSKLVAMGFELSLAG